MTGLGNVNPASGLRVSLTLRSSTELGAVYTCSFRGTETAYSGQATVDATSHAVVFEGLDDAPDWARTFAQGLLRTVARAVQEGRWPRRLTRWRSEPTRRAQIAADDPAV